MEVRGHHNFSVSREQLWEYLLDIEVLTKITPGISRLEELGNDEFRSIAEMRIGLYKSIFTGDMHVLNKNEPENFQIKMEQISRFGNVNATIIMTLEKHSETFSSITFEGKIQLTGIIRRAGKRVLLGVVNKIKKQVFAALENHIKENT